MPALFDLNPAETPEDVVLPVETRVKAGMALLDGKLGQEWVLGIALDSLRLEDDCRCVLGQLYGKYKYGGSDLFGPQWSFEDSVDCGFCISADDLTDGGGWGKLTATWREAIGRRRLELQAAGA